jgi:hypothetical protein
MEKILELLYPVIITLPLRLNKDVCSSLFGIKDGPEIWTVYSSSTWANKNVAVFVRYLSPQHQKIFYSWAFESLKPSKEILRQFVEQI